MLKVNSFVLTTIKSRTALTFVTLPPNDRNMHFTATLLGATLRAFGHTVTMCCEMLGVVGLKFETGQIFDAKFLNVA